MRTVDVVSIGAFWALWPLWIPFCLVDYARDAKSHRLPFWDYYIRSGKWVLSPYNRLLDSCSPSETRSAFVEKKWFPGHSRLDNQWPVIQEEAMRIWSRGMATDISDDLFFRHIVDSREWDKFYIKWYGKIDPLARHWAPKTVALIESDPSIKSAMFSILRPGAHIRAHKGPFRGALRYHLGLKTPSEKGCYILLNDQKYSWNDGEGVLFDDTYVHEVFNDSKETRIILFCDIERPLKSPARQVNKFVIDILAPFFTGRGNPVPVSVG